MNTTLYKGERGQWQADQYHAITDAIVALENVDKYEKLLSLMERDDAHNIPFDTVAGQIRYLRKKVGLI